MENGEAGIGLQKSPNLVRRSIAMIKRVCHSLSVSTSRIAEAIDAAKGNSIYSM